jgi:hypothetical protein
MGKLVNIYMRNSVKLTDGGLRILPVKGANTLFLWIKE